MSVWSHSSVKLDLPWPFTTVEDESLKPAVETAIRPTPDSGVSGDSVITVAVDGVVSWVFSHKSLYYALTLAEAAAGGISLNQVLGARPVNAELPVGAADAVMVVAVVTRLTGSPRPSVP